MVIEEDNNRALSMSRRMRVNSLLNPEPPQPKHKESSNSSNSSEGFEMALWRQETGLGPPEPSLIGGGTRFECFDQLNRPPTIQVPPTSTSFYSSAMMDAQRRKLHRASSGSGGSYQRHHPYMHYSRMRSSGGPEGQPQGSRLPAMATRVGSNSIQPQIFEHRPPIVGHSATSIDQSSDYIRPFMMDGGSHAHGVATLPPPLPLRLPESSSSSSVSPNTATVSSSSPSSPNAPSSRFMPPPPPPPLTANPHQQQMARTNMDYEEEEEDEDEDDAGNNGTNNSLLGRSCSTGNIGQSVSMLGTRGITPFPKVANSSTGGSVGAAKHQRQQQQTRNKKMSWIPPVLPRISSSNSNAKITPKSPPSTAIADKKQVVAAAIEEEDDAPLVDWKSLEVPQDIWEESLQLYERVKVMKKVQNRQPVRKRHAILAALMFILCRDHGYPRTFAEICTAANVTKREIGMYYKLMKQVLGTQYMASRRAPPSEFLQRWTSVLALPQWMAGVAAKIYDRVDAMGIVQGKCPISISAACIWLVVWVFNHRQGLAKLGFELPEDTSVSSAAVPNIPMLGEEEDMVECDPKEVCKVASVVIATLTSVFRLFLPKLSVLVDGLMDQHL